MAFPGFGLMNLLLSVKTWLLVVGVSALGTVASLAYYYLGKQGAEAVFDRFPQIDRENWRRVHRWYQARGSGLLFLSAIPMVGVLLTTAAGAVGIEVVTYLIWVLLGRLARNWVALLFFDQAWRLFFAG